MFLQDDSIKYSERTRSEDRVPLGSKIIFGMAGTHGIFVANLTNSLINPIFVVLLGLAPSTISLGMLLFRLYDAFFDPLVGWVSDNTRTRFGRRRPYLAVGAILAGLFLPVIWLVNPAWSSQGKTLWFIGSGLILYTFSSVFAMPYESMSLELTPDYNERTSVNSYKAFFQKAAVIVVGWSWFITQLPIFNSRTTGAADTLRGARGLAAVVGLAVIILGVLPAIYVKERYYREASTQTKVSLRDNFRYTFTNRPFVIMACMTVLFASALYLSGGISFYLRLYYVTAGDQKLSARIGGVESTLTMLLGMASIPAFAWLARRFGKSRALMVAMSLTFVGMLANWFAYTPRHPWLSMTSSIIFAPSITGIWQLIPSMNSDIVDYDELRTGERREGAFASIFSWIVKASFSIGLGLGGPIVQWLGFTTSLGSHQSAGTFLGMRIAFAVVPTVMLGAAMLILHSYPLTPERMGEIRRELEARRGKV